MTRILHLLVLALACVIPLTAQAQWKWRDKTGQVNVSDRPPPSDVADKDILQRPAPDPRKRVTPPAGGASGVPASAAPAASTPLETELQARKRAADAEQAAKTKAEEERQNALRAENCRAARNQMSALQSGQRIARMNDKGEREVLDDKGRAEEMRRARDAMGSNCK